VIALRRKETGVLVMELSEHFWPEDLESAIPVVHDIARLPQNPLLLLVAVDRDFDTPLWDFLGQILQPGILAQKPEGGFCHSRLLHCLPPILG